MFIRDQGAGFCHGFCHDLVYVNASLWGLVPTNVKSIIFWASVTIGDRAREIRKTFLTGVSRTRITKAYPG